MPKTLIAVLLGATVSVGEPPPGLLGTPSAEQQAEMTAFCTKAAEPGGEKACENNMWMWLNRAKLRQFYTAPTDSVPNNLVPAGR